MTMKNDPRTRRDVGRRTQRVMSAAVVAACAIAVTGTALSMRSSHHPRPVALDEPAPSGAPSALETPALDQSTASLVIPLDTPSPAPGDPDVEAAAITVANRAPEADAGRIVFDSDGRNFAIASPDDQSTQTAQRDETAMLGGMPVMVGRSSRVVIGGIDGAATALRRSETNSQDMTSRGATQELSERASGEGTAAIPSTARASEDSWSVASTAPTQSPESVPEPGSLLLIGTGLAAYAMRRRQRERASTPRRTTLGSPAVLSAAARVARAE